MIFRKALRLPENKKGIVFVRNEDGAFNVDMNKVNTIRKQWGDTDYDGTLRAYKRPKETKPNVYCFPSGDKKVDINN